jgi:hypothetical protein
MTLLPVQIGGIEAQYLMWSVCLHFGPHWNPPARVAVLDHQPVSQPGRQPIHEPVEHCHAS